MVMKIEKEDVRQIILVNKDLEIDKKELVNRILDSNYSYMNFIIELIKKYEGLEFVDEDFDDNEFTDIGNHYFWLGNDNSKIILKGSEDKIIKLINMFDDYGGKSFTEKNENGTIVCCSFLPMRWENDIYLSDETDKMYEFISELELF